MSAFAPGHCSVNVTYVMVLSLIENVKGMVCDKKMFSFSFSKHFVHSFAVKSIGLTDMSLFHRQINQGRKAQQTA